MLKKILRSFNSNAKLLNDGMQQPVSVDEIMEKYPRARSTLSQFPKPSHSIPELHKIRPSPDLKPPKIVKEPVVISRWVALELLIFVCLLVQTTDVWLYVKRLD